MDATLGAVVVDAVVEPAPDPDAIVVDDEAALDAELLHPAAPSATTPTIVIRSIRGGGNRVMGTFDHPNGAPTGAGSETTNRVPPPGASSTRALPPMAAASSRTMASPSPVPTARPGVWRTV